MNYIKTIVWMRAIEVERFQRSEQLRASKLDAYLPFLRQTLEEHPRLRATRLLRMLTERGYTGSAVQLRRVVARLRPRPQEAFLRLQTASRHSASPHSAKLLVTRETDKARFLWANRPACSCG